MIVTDRDILSSDEALIREPEPAFVVALTALVVIEVPTSAGMASQTPKAVAFAVVESADATLILMRSPQIRHQPALPVEGCDDIIACSMVAFGMSRFAS
jgi:hypothetical protein